MTIKIKVITKKLFKNPNSKSFEKEYYVNDILVCKTKKYKEYFCSINKKTGQRSNLRDHIKYAYMTSWNHCGLQDLLKDKYNSKDFNNKYPDLSWGYSGHAISKKEIVQIFENF